MRIGVLGNSDTTGQKIGAEHSWPRLIETSLAAELGADVQVDSWRFAAYRPNAVDFAMALVDEAKPDVVIVTLASYWCAFSQVSTGGEHRFGPKAARLYSRLERGFAGRFEIGGPALSARRRIARSVTRRVLGTGTLLSFEQFVDVFSDLVRQLARRESTEVLVLADHHFTSEVRRRMPNVGSTIARIEDAIKPIVQERRLHWGDLEDAIRAGGRRDDMIIADGVHMTPEAHRRVADALTRRLAALAPTITA